MKINFPAEVYIKRGDQKIPVCHKHANGLGIEKIIPKGSQVPCADCSYDFSNN